MKLPTLTVDFNCFYDPCLCCRTAKGSPPVTFAVAACETQNVSVSVLPCFGLSEGSGVTAKEMWEKMVKVLFCLMLCASFCFGIYLKFRWMPCIEHSINTMIWLIKLDFESNFTQFDLVLLHD